MVGQAHTPTAPPLAHKQMNLLATMLSLPTRRGKFGLPTLLSSRVPCLAALLHEGRRRCLFRLNIEDEAEASLNNQTQSAIASKVTLIQGLACQQSKTWVD
jgi:hypothetical protein